jgi:hypothetical protein
MICVEVWGWVGMGWGRTRLRGLGDKVRWEEVNAKARMLNEFVGE